MACRVGAVSKLARAQHAEEAAFLGDDARAARFVDEDDHERHQHDPASAIGRPRLKKMRHATEQDAGDREQVRVDPTGAHEQNQQQHNRRERRAKRPIGDAFVVSSRLNRAVHGKRQDHEARRHEDCAPGLAGDGAGFFFDDCRDEDARNVEGDIDD